MRRRGLEPPPGYPGPGPQPGNAGVISVQCVHLVPNVQPRGRYGRNGRSGRCHGCCHGPGPEVVGSVRRDPSSTDHARNLVSGSRRSPWWRPSGDEPKGAFGGAAVGTRVALAVSIAAPVVSALGPRRLVPVSVVVDPAAADGAGPMSPPRCTNPTSRDAALRDRETGAAGKPGGWVDASSFEHGRRDREARIIFPVVR
jgi:hypothetical protein